MLRLEKVGFVLLACLVVASCGKEEPAPFSLPDVGARLDSGSQPIDTGIDAAAADDAGSTEEMDAGEDTGGVLRCEPGTGNCDGLGGNGCEVDTNGSVEHCGACFEPCFDSDNATAICVGGECGFTCDPGY